MKKTKFKEHNTGDPKRDRMLMELDLVNDTRKRKKRLAKLREARSHKTPEGFTRRVKTVSAYEKETGARRALFKGGSPPAPRNISPMRPCKKRIYVRAHYRCVQKE